MSHTITFIKSKLIAAGVKNLREFGYPDCTKDNILTDAIYSELFKCMLIENKGNGADIDTAIDELLTQLS